jgi:NAD(P)-dependent dehydrogenase (short-subunit alcohol dehydrogenase family)
MMSTELHPLFNLTGSVALVTGSGSGLGREFCDVLAEFGADVVCPDIYRDRAEETCEIIKKYGHRTLPMEVDVSKYDQVQAMFRQVIAKFDKLDILVNNAGIAPPSVLIDQTDLDDWHRVIDVDLHGTFYCMKEGLGIMRKQERGVIINISSILGITGCDPYILAQAPYIASKFGVVGLTKQAAAEYGRYGIRVNCIAPGFHHGTRLPESLKVRPTEEEAGERQQVITRRTPLGRTGDPSELRGLLLYLASDSSSFMTGAVIVNDGGWTVS